MKIIPSFLFNCHITAVFVSITGIINGILRLLLSVIFFSFVSEPKFPAIFISLISATLFIYRTFIKAILQTVMFYVMPFRDLIYIWVEWKSNAYTWRSRANIDVVYIKFMRRNRCGLDWEFTRYLRPEFSFVIGASIRAFSSIRSKKICPIRRYYLWVVYEAILVRVSVGNED